ncbi:eukaryotic translation initiation factor 4G [Ceratobasidium sp. AG-Ba]|nr:eukaryotic translation initiation factor 4G [Ceratobasidium sp. AG-Ba]
MSTHNEHISIPDLPSDGHEPYGLLPEAHTRHSIQRGGFRGNRGRGAGRGHGRSYGERSDQKTTGSHPPVRYIAQSDVARFSKPAGLFSSPASPSSKNIPRPQVVNPSEPNSSTLTPAELSTTVSSRPKAANALWGAGERESSVGVGSTGSLATKICYSHEKPKEMPGRINTRDNEDIIPGATSPLTGPTYSQPSHRGLGPHSETPMSSPGSSGTRTFPRYGSVSSAPGSTSSSQHHHPMSSFQAPSSPFRRGFSGHYRNIPTEQRDGANSLKVWRSGLGGEQNAGRDQNWRENNYRNSARGLGFQMRLSRSAAPVEPDAPSRVTGHPQLMSRNPRQSQFYLVHRNVGLLLDKLTENNFDSISDQIIEWANKSEQEKDGFTLMLVIRYIFEKARDQAELSEIHALLCRKIMERISPNVQDENVRDSEDRPVSGGLLFRKYLLNLCQANFERGWSAQEAVAAPTVGNPGEGKAAEAASQANGEAPPHSEEYHAAAKAKRQGVGLVRFIGELFKFQMLTERIVHECIKKLLSNMVNPKEEEIESLCALLITAGQRLDNAKAKTHMDIYFERMREMSEIGNISWQLKLILNSTIELRQQGWRVTPNVGTQSLAAAKFIEDASKISYPDGIFGPRLNQSVSGSPTKFVYDRSFLIQFRYFCKMEPSWSTSPTYLGLSPGRLAEGSGRRQEGQMSAADQPRSEAKFQEQQVPKLTPMSFRKGSWPISETPELLLSLNGNNQERLEVDLTENRVKPLLNALTADVFSSTLKDILEYLEESEAGGQHSTLPRVVELILENTKSDRTYSRSIYAQLCQAIIRAERPNTSFHNRLLSHCRYELSAKGFAQHASYSRTGRLGIMQFIGHLLELGAISTFVVNEPLRRTIVLGETLAREQVESICELLKVAGPILDHPNSRNTMNFYYGWIKRSSEKNNIDLDVRRMLQDLAKLRQQHWHYDQVPSFPPGIAAICTKQNHAPMLAYPIETGMDEEEATSKPLSALRPCNPPS